MCGLRATAILVISIIMINGNSLVVADNKANIDESKNLESASELNIYWVGHSLMEHVADTSFGQVSVLDLVSKFAEFDGRGYSEGNHTLWGAPLSLQWSGEAHGYQRRVPERIALRQEFEQTAGTYNAIVLTETVPVGSAIKYEYSAYYLRKFYCSYLNENPKGKVYLYEGWVGLQSEGEEKYLSQQQWRDSMQSDRKKWDSLAINASDGNVIYPGLWNRTLSWFGLGYRSECAVSKPIIIIPVGTALLKLHDKLSSDALLRSMVKTNGSPIKFTDFIANPYLDWPYKSEPNGTKDDVTNLSKFKGGLRNPDQEWDDIHPSGIGVYFNSLVTYSMLYRASPIGLPALYELGDTLSLELQEIAWGIVDAEFNRW